MMQELSDSCLERISCGVPTREDCERAIRGMELDEACLDRFERGVPTMSDCQALMKARHKQAMQSLEDRGRGGPVARSCPLNSGRGGEADRVQQSRTGEDWNTYMNRRLTEDVATADAPSIFHLDMFRNSR